MRKLAVWLVVLGLMITPAAIRAASEGEKEKEAAAATKPDPKAEAAKKTAEKSKPEETSKPGSSLEIEIQQLKDLIQAQAQELAALREQQAKTEVRMKQISAAQPAAAQPGSEATGSAITATPAAESRVERELAQEKTGAEETSALQLRVGSAYITPVGFMDFTSVWRNHDGGSGIGTNFAGIPYGNIFQNNLSEFRFSMQNSRIGFRVDAMVKGAHVIGYMESDYPGEQSRKRRRQQQ